MVTREQLIQQSVQEYAKDRIFNVQGQPTSKIDVMDSFADTEFEGPLTKNILTAGFNFDDQGTQGELGSDLTRRVYTIEWFVFAISATWGENLAHGLKFALEDDKVIPLLNVTEDGNPQIDALEVIGVSAETVPVPEPQPWEDHVYRVVIQVQDEYFPGQAWF